MSTEHPTTPTPEQRERARQLREALELRTRTDATEYYALRADAPTWMHNAISGGHEGYGPNDWRYVLIVRVLDILADDNYGTAVHQRSPARLLAVIPAPL